MPNGNILSILIKMLKFRTSQKNTKNMSNY